MKRILAFGTGLAVGILLGAVGMLVWLAALHSAGSVGALP
jgi:hypothetical protein